GPVGRGPYRARSGPGRRSLRSTRGHGRRCGLPGVVDGAWRRGDPRRHRGHVRRTVRVPPPGAAAGPGTGMTVSPDARLILAAQAVRAFAYGLGAVLLGTTLEQRGLSSVGVGIVLAAVVAGTVTASVTVARWGDRFGRRRFYAWLYVALAVVGIVFAEVSATWVLVLVA